MGRRLLYPWGEPPRRLVGCCMFCRRLMFWRRERYCEQCLKRARELAAEVFD